MKTSPKDPIREERIDSEAIVDAYRPEEKAMSWYCYLEAKLTFPFHARCTMSKITSPLMKGGIVEVRGLAPQDSCTEDMLVQIRWQDRRWPFLYRS